MRQRGLENLPLAVPVTSAKLLTLRAVGVALDRLIRESLQDELGREVPRVDIGEYNRLGAHYWQVGVTILLALVLVLAAFLANQHRSPDMSDIEPPPQAP